MNQRAHGEDVAEVELGDFALPGEPALAVDVAVAGIGLAVAAPLFAERGSAGSDVEAVGEALGLVLGLHVEACLAGVFESLGAVGGCPRAVAARPSVFVHVVGVGKKAVARAVAVEQREEPRHEAVAASAAGLGIGHGSPAVLALERHVHHVVFLLHVVAQKAATLGALVVDLRFFTV